MSERTRTAAGQLVAHIDLWHRMAFPLGSHNEDEKDLLSMTVAFTDMLLDYAGAPPRTKGEGARRSAERGMQLLAERCR